MMFLLEKLLCFLILVVPILISVAYLTLAERKIMGSMQQRKGPNVIGFLGLLQPLADGLKLLIKETVIPTNANTFSFIFAPVLTLFLSLFGWSLIPLSYNSFYVDIDLSLLFIFAVSSLGVYGIILSGWSSNSRYAFFGSLRSASQMVSYEVSIGLILIIVLVCVGSLNFFSIVLFQEFLFFLVPLFPIFFMFLVSILAETNRAPFDLPEAESELVSGYNVEYASMGFALFFLAEYSSMILMSALTTIIFIGGWISIFSKPFILDSFALTFKLSIILFFFIWVRASFPRYRIDQLMRLCWKVFLPISLSFVLVTFSLLWCFNGVL
uniref:NADH-ubiquinone oxidoreductase chain 1 n=2 Tax=Phaeocystis globosa TaxID=33658 RepID=A0A8A1RX50_9EUKA|nr:NADH dehydrogenase subunit 1 [Phaeocystis globosa]QST19761.2 NADH dehydrogenase subunit 1 [Phaeocystis globosa]